jgi:hypothetical protein
LGLTAYGFTVPLLLGPELRDRDPHRGGKEEGEKAVDGHGRAFAERIRFRGYCLFIVLVGLLVYNPLCHWVWAPDGFLFNMGARGAIDFAGGLIKEINSKACKGPLAFRFTSRIG